MAIGSSFGSAKKRLVWDAVSETTAARVTSEPVPAVVGIAKKGAGGRFTFIMPSSFSAGPGFVASAAITLAASIEDPPPTASTPSHASRRSCAKPASTWAKVGSGSTPEYRDHSTPHASSMSVMRPTIPIPTSVASVTTSSFPGAMCPIVSHSSREASAPT